ncbi:MAG: hypothetical protein AAGD25_32330 [Cyanobacteria bacterium P01_F01_bin.150]
MTIDLREIITVTTPYQNKRNQANQDFQASLHQLEDRLLHADDEQAKTDNSDKSPLPLKTENRLPFRYSSTATLSQQEFDLESLQEAVADIDQFMNKRR